ncbi:glycosyltransferase 87 family protein [Bradyrhizobium sp. URHD0069]|uniref:glycosyltransferase 87 family protein n=1 Tax=Bradyrhizobium sp. URHD0069 TaxID=1380355 RepID=UPI0004969836
MFSKHRFRAGGGAVFINAVGGQNSTWTAALFGGGLSPLERRPLLAGGLLGLLIYKPQLGLLIPVALAGRHWRASEGVAVSLGERDVAYWQILLQKSFCTTDQKFSGL